MKCIQCHKTFWSQNSNVRICSDDCRKQRSQQANRRRYAEKVGKEADICITCGESFIPKRAGTKLCGSKECKAAQRRAITKKHYYLKKEHINEAKRLGREEEPYKSKRNCPIAQAVLKKIGKPRSYIDRI